MMIVNTVVFALLVISGTIPSIAVRTAMGQEMPTTTTTTNNNNNNNNNTTTTTTAGTLGVSGDGEMPIGEPGSNTNETDCWIFLEEYDQRAMEVYSRSIEKSWIYNTNITDYNQGELIAASMESSRFSEMMRQRALVYNTTGFNDTTKRLVSNLLFIGNAALENKTEFEELTNLRIRMKGRYSKGKVCKEDGFCYTLSPDLEHLMASSRNYSELYWAWDGWRDSVGGPARQDFVRYVELENKVARANGEADYGAFWRSFYEVDNFEELVEGLYQQIRPLYEHIHAYVRRKLYAVYGPDYINLRGPIPAHILGNMWAQTWDSLNDICRPFPDKSRTDVTASMIAKNYTVRQMFEISEEFFTSLGLEPMPESFWENSMLVRPTDGREVNCHASAWDFYNQKDFRIKMCTTITMHDLIIVHHEMGHVQYYLQYKDQPVDFRSGANSAFHEAVGDIMTLSVSTPAHLHKIGLLDEVDNDTESDLNYLMGVALRKVAFLPYAYMMDQWRWGVFNGSTPQSKYNQDWWNLRLRYQGIIPPVERTESDLDPAAKYHIAANVPYIRYFISFVIQFQFHDALCKAAGQTGPLYKCDIYNSREAGVLLGNMLRKGSSEPWPVAMEAITGSRSMNATALLSYFEPLVDYLQRENARNGETLGWPEYYSPADPLGADGRGQSLKSMVTLIIALQAVAVFRFCLH